MTRTRQHSGAAARFPSFVNTEVFLVRTRERFLRKVSSTSLCEEAERVPEVQIQR